MVNALEVGWFAPLCDDDALHLGIPDPERAASFEHCSEIVLEAERQGFDTVLLPSGYELGIDNTTFAAGIAIATSKIRLLLAVRTGELWPPQLARQLASIDQMAHGRLDVNIISSPLPGETLDGPARYERASEVMTMLDQLLRGQPSTPSGPTYAIDTDAPRVARDHRRRPPFYFGGLSEPARALAASQADVYLMWPDTLEQTKEIVDDLRGRAQETGRDLKVGYRVHVIVRPSMAEAREAARELVSQLEPEAGAALRSRALDAGSVGVGRQGSLRDLADEGGYVDDVLFTEIGRARSGCGAAVVGDPQTVIDYFETLAGLGIDALILSGYPHLEECRRVGELVLPRLAHGPLSLAP